MNGIHSRRNIFLRMILLEGLGEANYVNRIERNESTSQLLRFSKFRKIFNYSFLSQLIEILGIIHQVL